LQGGNRIGVASVCRIIAAGILHNVTLTTVISDHHPSLCVRHDAWKSEGLPVPPREVLAVGGFDAVLRLFRVRRVFARNFKLLRAQLTPCPRLARSSTAKA
jgi:hypothetical protein